MPNAHWIIDKLLASHAARKIFLPKATHSYLESARVKANALPPDLTLEEATIIEVLYRTYLPWEAK